jgi:signal transduction histidine kinase
MSVLKRGRPVITPPRGANQAGGLAIRDAVHHQSPYRLAVLLALCVFLAESLVMIGLRVLPDFPIWFEVLFDSTMLIVLLSPVLYYLVYRPFEQNIADLGQAEQALQETNKELEKKVAARTAELQKQTHDLNEQVKKLNCLYGISDLFERPNISLEEILKETVNLIPPSRPFPEIACARILLDRQKYQTENFKETQWKQDCNIMVQDESIGSLEVFYLEDRPEISQGRFLREEKSLMKAISERLGRIIELKQASEYLHQAHQQLAFKAADLEAANSELSQYAHVAAHDLKAPLRAINNYASFIAEDLGPGLKAEQKKYMDALGRAVDEAGELVQDLLKMSNIGLGANNIESVHLGSFLKELTNSISPGPDVKISLADEWPLIEADPVLLRQVFQNLVENAVKFNHSEKICVELGWDLGQNGEHEFFVRDNGLGIEQRYHDQIFRVFERLHTRRQYEGTGIGLSIVKKAVTKLGGAIRVDSRPGRGSTFYVILPVTQQPRLI